MTEEKKDINQTTTNTTEGNDLYKGMERSELLLQERENARLGLAANKDSVSAIQKYMSATDGAIAQLKAEKALISNKSADYKNLWVDANTHAQDLSRKIDYLETNIRESQQTQLQGIGAKQAQNDRNYADYTSKESLKKRLTQHFQDSLKNDKW